jgi:hypothetical protein
MSLGADIMLLQMWQKRLSRNAVKKRIFSFSRNDTSFATNIFLFYTRDNEKKKKYIYIYNVHIYTLYVLQ